MTSDLAPADLEAVGLSLRSDTLGRRIDPTARTVEATGLAGKRQALHGTAATYDV